jgi:SPASM domain peptide maturase of grasp-with-spasm system
MPVIGARRSSLCDLQRGLVQLVPSGLAEMLKTHRGKAVAEIKAAYEHRYDARIEEYFRFLIANEFGFWCDDDVDAFPEINIEWDEPERITNAIIDIDISSEHNLFSILKDLDDLGCKALQVRFYSGGRIGQLRELLSAAHGTCLRAIDLVVPFHVDDTQQEYQQLCLDFPRISHIFVHSSPFNRAARFEQMRVPLVYRTSVVDSPACCGEVHASYFVAHIKTFTEAQSHNTCLNRKISIDARGDIRNCPSLPHSFGNIRDTSLHSALAQRDFTELWSINKNQIEICRDCEFRYVCIDCRAYLTQPAHRFSKPAKCGYDPYTAQWR